MLKANFNITETGGTGIVQLQSSADQGASWQNVGTPLTLAQGALTIDDSANLTIDTSIFIPGHTYDFRLTDTAGSPVSTVQSWTIHTITGYTAGTGIIGFSSTGVDSWEIDFHSTPATLQVSPGATQTGYNYDVTFWSAGASTSIETGQQTVDHSVPASGLGSGVYVAQCQYIFSDSSAFVLARVVRVDSTGAIIADIQINGSTITGQEGLQLTEQATIIQTGVSYGIKFAAFDSHSQGPGTLLASTDPATFTVPLGTDIISVVIDFDAIILDDFPSDFFPYHFVFVS